MSAVEVLDPRYDAEPPYWARLRERAGLHVDWSWDVLTARAWAARGPQPVTVLHGEHGPTGVVAACWVGPGARRHRFGGLRRAGRWGGLDVRAPGVTALPAWWFDPATTGPDAGGVDRLLADYLPAMRRELGGLGVALVRQVPSTAVPLLRGRHRLVRETEPLSVVDTAGLAGRDDWLAGLSRKRRQSLTRMYRALDVDETIAVRVGPAADLDPVAVAELLRLNEVKHRDVPIVPLPQFVGHLSTLFAHPEVLAVRYDDVRDGTLLGVAVILDHPELPVARFWSARPPEEGGRPDLYFHLYGELVRWATGAGRSGVLLGKKMAELKTSLGARAIPQYAAALPFGR